MNKLEDGLELNLQFEKRGGVLPVVVTEKATGEVLMLAYTNQEAFDLTCRYGMAYFYSTSKKALWKKGETSGDLLEVLSIRIDCDQDALWYEVKRLGDGVCHTVDPISGKHRRSCFYREFKDGELQ